MEHNIHQTILRSTIFRKRIAICRRLAANEHFANPVIGVVQVRP